MFDQSNFLLIVLKTYCINVLLRNFIISLVCLFCKVDIIRITKYDYDKYFIIAEWGKSCGSCDAKIKWKYQREKGRNVKC